MPSQDTLQYAEHEEESARVFQREIEDEQADIDSLQRDIDSKRQTIAGLRQKQEQHTRDAQRLREKAVEEQKQEQQEELRRQQEEKDSLLKRGAKEAVKRSFF